MLLRILSFNTASFNEGPLWLSQRGDWDFRPEQKRRVAEIILKERPEILCLQESLFSFPEANTGSLLEQQQDAGDGGGLLPPPMMCLDLENGEDKSSSTVPLFDISCLTDEYIFLGKTETHADFTMLLVRKDLHSRVQFVSCVGGEQGGGVYNFPLAVLKLSDDALVAVTSVHLTPFSSAGGMRNKSATHQPQETRREAQLRRTVAGLYSALAHTLAHVPGCSGGGGGGGNKISKATILVAGDTNMRDTETSAIAALELQDAHEVLRAMAPTGQLQVTSDSMQVVEEATAATAATESAAPPVVWTWDTAVNRFNGQGAKYQARYDRVFARSFAAGGASASSLVDALKHEAARCLLPQQQEGDAPSSLVSSLLLRPSALRLVGHKPIVDPRLDALETAAREKRLASGVKRVEVGLMGKVELSDNDDDDEDDDPNEHSGPVPAGGRVRFLSDHFGVVCDFNVLL